MLTLGDNGIRVATENVSGGERSVSKSEPSTSAIRCRKCGKHIIWPGLCYTCATGLPRQMVPEALVGAEPISGRPDTRAPRNDSPERDAAPLH